MGRNKFSDTEIKAIAKLLRLKNAGNRHQQKLVRHDLRVDYEFNISDFNQPGKAFGEEELYEAIQRGAISILDERTIADMKRSEHATRHTMLHKKKRLLLPQARLPTGVKLWKSGRNKPAKHYRKRVANFAIKAKTARRRHIIKYLNLSS